jgi:pimeloyl-ACP methyl ester carboxylesterase
MDDDRPYPVEQQQRAGRRAEAILAGSDFMASLVPLLARLSTPALLITGAHDLVAGPDQIAAFRSTVPSGTVETFAEVGHFVQLEEPERYADLVAGFTLGHR